MSAVRTRAARRLRPGGVGALVLAAMLLAAGAVRGQHSGHDHAQHHAAGAPASGVVGAPAAPASAADARQWVEFPPALAAQTLANMRDHLLALAEIQAALAGGRYDVAARAAEQRLGMGSMQGHGAHEVARYMPPGMQAAGLAMHRSASRLALEVENSAATGDLAPALDALATLTRQCVACHAAYRLH